MANPITLGKLRDRFIPILRWKHWGSFFLFVAVVAVLANALKDAGAAGGQKVPGVFALSAFSLGLVIKLRDLFRSFKVWRWLRPSYRGLDDFLKRLDSSPLFSRAFVTPDEGEVMIDAPAFISQAGGLLRRIDLVSIDPALNAIAARINSEAFRGTTYQASTAEKLKRNQRLSAAHPASFALIRSSDARYSHDGLAVVLPMNRFGLSAYLAGKLSDNDIAPRHLALAEETPEGLLIFLIANASARHARRERHYPDMLDSLVQLCIIQIIMFASNYQHQREFKVFVANAERKWGSAFKKMQFVECPEYESADQQTVYECRVRVRDATDAMRTAANVMPPMTLTKPDRALGLQD